MGVFAFKLSNAASKSTRAKVLKLAEKNSDSDRAGLAFGCIDEVAVFSGEFGSTTTIWSFLNVSQIGVNDFTL